MKSAKDDQANLSVVITTYNRPNALDLVLEGYSNQIIKAKQIIIADDGSTESTANVVEGWKKKGLPLLHCWHKDCGFRRAEILNKAIQEVTTSYVIFTDGDCIPLSTFVEDHWNYAEEGHLLAGGRILTSESFTKKLESGVETLSNQNILYWLTNRILGNVNRIGSMLRLPDGKWRKARPSSWEIVRGCNFSLALVDILRSDGFDETFVGWGYEDSEFAVRIINNGIRVKNLRYAAPLLHLWHQEFPRDKASENYHRLKRTINEKRLRPKIGLSTRLPDRLMPNSTL
jgi:glycosyltransferase involved in cell wall biosynthesis